MSERIPHEIDIEEVEQRLLAFCRTARVLPGDDLRARSTWPAQFVDIARKIDEELRWSERADDDDDEVRRFIPSARDLSDVLIAGDWFARLRDVRFDSKYRKAWDFTLEQKLIWWRSMQPQPGWRLIEMWHGGISHTALRNRYKRAIERAHEIANKSLRDSPSPGMHARMAAGASP